MNSPIDKSPSRARNHGRNPKLRPLSNGFFIVLPLLLIGLVLEQLFLALQRLFLPLLNALPGVVFRRPSVRLLVVCLVFAVLLFVVGLLARTRVCKAIGRRLESALQNRVPLYLLLRNVSNGLSDRSDGSTLRPALITVDSPGLMQLGLIVERHANGSATVFLPASPNSASGTVVVVVGERIREMDVPVSAVFRCAGGWGHGTAALLEKG